MVESVKLWRFDNLDASNKPTGRVCLHCDNDGWVDLDMHIVRNGTRYENFAAPCPMCALGMAIDCGSNGEKQRYSYWMNTAPDRVTWNRGLTMNHTGSCTEKVKVRDGERRCAAPAIGGFCNHHRGAEVESKSNPWD